MALTQLCNGTYSSGQRLEAATWQQAATAAARQRRRRQAAERARPPQAQQPLQQQAQLCWRRLPSTRAPAAAAAGGPSGERNPQNVDQPLLLPSPTFTPEEAVAAQLDALARNDEPWGNHGVQVRGAALLGPGAAVLEAACWGEGSATHTVGPAAYPLLALPAWVASCLAPGLLPLRPRRPCTSGRTTWAAWTRPRTLGAAPALGSPLLAAAHCPAPPPLPTDPWACTGHSTGVARPVFPPSFFFL